ncbi:hypothetical protein BDN70DRAFT_872185 [Pholiota conissans]|uniref:F-box domain-containing protein n=1 Tax=Pholiota conissans TaxID=109636 RepID=A0A9P5ZAW1_9AGAR|nr:hypothetical protein BDN70DRAFT_872185 [Pholiota conissans]
MSPRAPSARLLAKRLAGTSEATKPPIPASTSRKRQKVAPTQKEVKPQPNVPRVDDFRKIKGRRGQLKAMTELPLDVLTEIFGHLQPYDLLCVSRASKELRDIVVGENTASLWKKTYANVHPLPPNCPPETSISWYTDFLFGRGCQFCPATKASVVHWKARARLCNRCAKTELMSLAYYSNIPTVAAHRSSASSYTGKSGVLRYGMYILKQEHDYHVRKLAECADVQARESYTTNRTRYLERNDSFTYNLHQWDSARRSEIQKAQQQIRFDRQKAITDRLTAAGYGPEIGIGRYRVSRLPGGDHAFPLTNKEWEKIKIDIIRVYEWQRQETRKSNMIRSFQMRLPHLTMLIEKSQEGTPRPWFYPPTSQIARAEPFASVMKGNAEDSSLDGLIPIKLAMDALKDHIPKLIEVWRDDADRFLLSLVSGGKETVMQADGEKIDRQPLELATTFFKCHCSCKEPISYPRILMHSCLRSHRIPDKDDDDAPQENEDKEHDEDEEDVESHQKGQEERDTSVSTAEVHDNPNEIYGIPTTTPDVVWNKMSSWWSAQWNETDMIELDEEAIGFARAIVQACGEDPDTVTSTTMNAHDIRVECMRCVPPPGKKGKGRSRHIMTWKAAILHDIGYHFEETPSETGWKLLTDEDELRQVHELENKPTPTEKKMKLFVYPNHCFHCDDRPPNIYPGLFTPSSKVGPSETETIESGADTEQAHVKRHICTGVDAPMKAHPNPVKI